MAINSDFWLGKLDTDIAVLKSQKNLIDYTRWCLDNYVNGWFVDFYFENCHQLLSKEG